MGVLGKIRAWLGGIFGATGYEGATTTRRGQGFRDIGGPADDVAYWDVVTLRERSRSLCRNHWAGKRAKSVLVAKIVGQGILPSSPDPELNAYLRLWARPQAQVGAEFGQSLSTVQRLAASAVFESGSCLVVRQWRTKRQMLERGLVTPFQLAVLEPEFLDSTRDGVTADGHVIVGGVEYDPSGWAVGYWLYDERPDSSLRPSKMTSHRVRAADVAQVYWSERPGQTIGVPWLAPVLLKMKDFDEYEDAQLVRQKVAAMYALFVTSAHPDKEAHVDDDIVLEPGLVQFLRAGESIEAADPPSVAGYEEFSRINLRSIAAFRLGPMMRPVSRSETPFSSQARPRP
jgi:lambda family phage portal protein